MAASPSNRPSTPQPGHACQVFLASDIYVTSGANHGDGLQGPQEVDQGDVYQLDRYAVPLRLVVSQAEGQDKRVAPGSELGEAWAAIRLEARYAMMAPEGDKMDLLVLLLGGTERVALPLSPIEAQVDYTLLSVEPAPDTMLLADRLCLPFARGTMITLAHGNQRAIEALKAGDWVLTRDHGKQCVRWIGNVRMRAVGAFAPVVIPAGTLGNLGDLIMSQHQRVFLPQRQELAGLSTHELLIRARHFVDSAPVYLREGGFVDYFGLVFDHHEIIYAEGIPAESLMVNDATLSRLPPEIAADIRACLPGLMQNPHFTTEAGWRFPDAIGPKRQFRARKGRGL